ncbi:ROK family protein [Xinfangfangia sp. D13-10-4-6]|uniref:ROK family protein n=1 Tax=Pseudogemmobacter hezensis TaxID=2737662 RepID=UPI0015575DEF|nr:ROK family protein [Pseudogemmobacter hezensis]NPD16086.1 ROK family protein [Pseudogemmobacter hezensis]
MAPHQRFLGVDIGGTKVLAVLTDARGQVLAEHQQPTDTRGGAHLADQLLAISQRLDPKGAALAVGVGLPASVDPRSHALSLIPNIADMEGTHFHALLTARFGPQLRLENDVNTAALAEARAGEAGDPLAFIAIGTGIGMGLVANGGLLRGMAGAAGEIALLPIGGDARDAFRRGSGALEDCLGGSGWRAACQAAGAAPDADLAALFASDDPVFERVLHAQADLLAQAVLAVSAVAAPEVFVFGGSIGGQPRLLAAVQAVLPQYFTTPPRLRPSVLGHRAGAIGAALAAADLCKKPGR